MLFLLYIRIFDYIFAQCNLILLSFTVMSQIHYLFYIQFIFLLFSFTFFSLYQFILSSLCSTVNNVEN